MTKKKPYVAVLALLMTVHAEEHLLSFLEEDIVGKDLWPRPPLDENADVFDKMAHYFVSRESLFERYGINHPMVRLDGSGYGAYTKTLTEFPREWISSDDDNGDPEDHDMFISEGRRYEVGNATIRFHYAYTREGNYDKYNGI